MHIGAFAYVDPAEGSIDVNFFVLVFVIAVFFYIDIASGKNE